MNSLAPQYDVHYLTERWNVDRRLIYAAARANELHAVRIGREFRFSGRAILDFEETLARTGVWPGTSGADSYCDADPGSASD